jgi:bifunctional DNA-binding transcriptional regulator/antitoxin component of YhaV-PrlF toxin-antitoxin module
MKGILRKIDESWVVEYKFEKDLFSSEGGQIPIFRETFDMNANQPIIVLKDGKEVEFELMKVFLADETKIYAKLIKSDYPELEGTMTLCEEISDRKIETAMVELSTKIESSSKMNAFKLGAKWMRDQYIKK